MRLPEKFNPIFDKFLLGGLGCGLIVLCILMAGFFFIWQNPPRPAPTTTQTPLGGLSTGMPGPTATPLFLFATPTVLPTGFATLPPTQAGELPGTSIPSPVLSFDDSPPVGKIVFTCFVEQIDQICLINADGSDYKRLTDFEGTSFYASISPGGNTIYFSSRRSGGYEIYSMNL